MIETRRIKNVVIIIQRSFVLSRKIINIYNNIARKYENVTVNATLFRSAINKPNKEPRHLSKELSLFKNFLSKQLSSIDIYILIKSITSHNKKSLKKSLYTHKKSYVH